MPVKALITGPGMGVIAEVHPDVVGVNRLHVDAIIETAHQAPIPVTLTVPSGERLPKIISLYYNTSVGAIVSGQYKRAITYTVPAGFNGSLLRYTSFQAETADSRVVSELNMGTLNLITNVFVYGYTADAYIFPQWVGDVEAELTQAVGPAAGVVVTVTYTNHANISGRVGTFTIPKNSIIGTRINFVLQADDLGVVSIQAASTAPTASSGALKILGLLQLAYHEDGGTAASQTLYASGTVGFATDTVIGIEHQGGTVAKARRFDAMIQLTEAVIVV